MTFSETDFGSGSNLATAQANLDGTVTVRFAEITVH